MGEAQSHPESPSLLSSEQEWPDNIDIRDYTPRDLSQGSEYDFMNLASYAARECPETFTDGRFHSKITLKFKDSDTQDLHEQLQAWASGP